MKAVIIEAHGGREALKFVTDQPDPTPSTGEVLVEIAATTVNQSDRVIRNGYPGMQIPLPHILGGDIVGRVAALGAGVESVKVGDRVMCHPIISCGDCALCHAGKKNLCINWKYFGMHIKGGYGEFAVAPERNLIGLPDGVSFGAAATLPVAGLTAYHALKTVAQLKPGETFFIWGGSGGLGTFAVQIAKHLGATVIATGGSDEKLRVMKSLGADYVFNRFEDDVPSAVRKIAPAGLDVAIDYVGPETFPKTFDLIKKGGRILLCGIITGREATLSLHQTYLRHISIRGLYLGSKGELNELLDLVETGAVKPYICDTLPLDEASEAHRRLECGEIIGKLVMRVG